MTMDTIEKKIDAITGDVANYHQLPGITRSLLRRAGCAAG